MKLLLYQLCQYKIHENISIIHRSMSCVVINIYLICVHTVLLLVMRYRMDIRRLKKTQCAEQGPKTEKTDVDCSSSSRGLFLGIIVLVAIVITTITFFVLVQIDAYKTEALRLEHLSDMIIYIIMTFAFILAYYRMRLLGNSNSKWRYEHVLLFISLIAVFVLCICNMIAGGFYVEPNHGLLLGLAGLTQLIEASVQFVFLRSMANRSCQNKDQEMEKAGREFVTFALICNIAVFGLNVFIQQRWNIHDLQEAFYGPICWTMIAHVTVPISLLYRFMSTVLLMDVWMYSWKTP